MLKIIFIHGNGGCTYDTHWYQSAKHDLETAGYTTIVETFPDNVLARSSYWLPFLKNVLEADEQTILVGHSSGAVAAMRYAEENKILGSVLVAGCYTDLGIASERQSGYFDATWQWDKIKKNQNWIVQFASADDPYIPIEEARFIHGKLASQYYEIKGKGHFMQKTFPELSAVIIEHLKDDNNEGLSLCLSRD